MTLSTSSPRYGLVLSGGGARAAYQAGVLQGISDILGTDCGPQPFSVITGISAGAINTAFIAAATDSFAHQTQKLIEVWNELEPEHVLRTDFMSLGKLGAGWIRDLSFGGMLGNSQSTHLLDSTPLARLLDKRIDFNQIQENIKNKTIHGVAVSATNYATGTSNAFFNSLEVENWARSSRIGLKTDLNLDHILASSAIPFIFKPVRINKSFYGDGGVRSNTPFSPAIHLGADRLIAIGVRYFRDGLETMELNQQLEMDSIALSDIVGVMFNSLFLDAIEFDYERLQRINETVKLLHEVEYLRGKSRLKMIPTLLIRPSVDLGELAAEQFERFPHMLRYLLKGIGASRERGADLLSYIAFDKAYTSKLIEIGIKDTMSRKDEIRAFFELEL
ncbi:patatin-like phospholipase family protein [Bacteriovorax sp. PP10]|uniref:Patatin-like phospholipase family protein n=1 Tax=Bacteriovorax antarcticus TaxID=3088717 RepID=A0ABU5VVF6_9BACT|nr:patatin-like phospholipase family protein [Bacteriovorax sp. PP10]MEA9357043.1 patatin-like phospholipase family protein [Bacteriovorax sp. PP10]